MSATVITYDSPFDFCPQLPTVYPNYVSASCVANKLNSDDATLELGWSYTIVNYMGGFAVMVIDEDGHSLGKL